MYVPLHTGSIGSDEFVFLKPLTHEHAYEPRKLVHNCWHGDGDERHSLMSTMREARFFLNNFYLDLLDFNAYH